MAHDGSARPPRCLEEAAAHGAVESGERRGEELRWNRRSAVLGLSALLLVGCCALTLYTR